MNMMELRFSLRWTSFAFQFGKIILALTSRWQSMDSGFKGCFFLKGDGGLFLPIILAVFDTSIDPKDQTQYWEPKRQPMALPNPLRLKH